MKSIIKIPKNMHINKISNVALAANIILAVLVLQAEGHLTPVSDYGWKRCGRSMEKFLNEYCDERFAYSFQKFPFSPASAHSKFIFRSFCMCSVPYESSEDVFGDFMNELLSKYTVFFYILLF